MPGETGPDEEEDFHLGAFELPSPGGE